MNKDVFDQIIDLIQKTGDTLIIFDEKRGAYTVMNFKNYQKLVGAYCYTPVQKKEISGNVDLTEIELLDKINKEINLWKASQEQKTSEVELSENLSG